MTGPRDGGSAVSPRDAALGAILGTPPGADAAALLGVDANDPADGEIVAALNRRLSQVNAHARGGTPLGDEVRLALHAAAAQLLSARPASSASAARATPAGNLPPAHVALEQTAIVALGMHGGWNRRTMRHLAKLTHARGLRTDDLAVALARLARRSNPAATPSHNGQATDAEDHEASESIAQRALFDADMAGARSSDAALFAAMAVAVLLTLVAGAAVLIAIPVMRNAATHAPADPPPEVVATGPSDEQIDAAQEALSRLDEEMVLPPPRPIPSVRLDTVVTDLRLAAARRRAGDASAQAVFERSIDALARGWHELPADQRSAALSEVIDHVYLVADDQASLDAVLGFLASPFYDDVDQAAASTLPPRIWQWSLLARLTREEDLPAAGMARVRRALGDLPADLRTTRSFDEAAASGLTALLASEAVLIPADASAAIDLDAWDAWIACARGVGRGDGRLGQRLLLAGLERVLHAAPEPTESEASFRLVRRLVVALSWRPGDEARDRLLVWFDDTQVSIADLHAITNALATASAAPGVDPTMVLPVLASPTLRSQVRDRFAGAWGVRSSLAHDAVATNWLAAADALLATPVATTAAANAVDTAIAARLSASAALLWQGRTDEADAVLLTLRDGLTADAASANAGVRTIWMAAHGQPSDWALRFLEQRYPELQVELIDELASGGPRHAVEAELLVDAYLRGRVASVRTRAGDVLLANAGSPLVIAAALEVLPMPGSDFRKGELVELLTGIRLPEGDARPLVARRALVERLLQLLANEGELATIDRAAAAIGNAYALALGAATPGVNPATSTGDTPPELAAELLWTQLRSRADRVIPPQDWPWRPGDIDRRLNGRTRLATGRIQRFAAFQASLTEIWLYVAAGERPELAATLAEQRQAMRDARRDAGGILEQLAIVERARLAAWRERVANAGLGGPQ
ncbi:MAG: hypothetical protein AAFX79_07340 [Planctomycetota bacterium]